VVMCVARPRTLRGRWATVEWYGRDTCAYKARTEIGTLPLPHRHELIAIEPLDCTAATSRYWRDSIPRRVHRIHHSTKDARPLTGLDILVQPISDAHPNEIRFGIRFGVRNENYCKSVAES
jgi:hypothetical protein